VSPFPSPLPLLSFKWGFVLGISVSLQFFFEHPKEKKKPKSPQEESAAKGIMGFIVRRQSIPNINFTNEARIDRLITDHLCL
jgi:hypothetical protein